MNEAFHLSRLQKVDTQIDQLNNRLAEIELTLANNAALRQAEEQVAASNRIKEAAKKSLRHAEDAVNLQRTKIELSEASLYGGKIRNPKELQDIQNELASLKRHLSGLEDQLLETMLAFEQAEADGQTSDASLMAVKADFASRSAEILGEQSRLANEKKRLLAEREPMAAQISAANYELYEKLRRQKRGVAVAGILDESCTACGATITQKLWQAARSPLKIEYCPSCGRILYAG